MITESSTGVPPRLHQAPAAAEVELAGAFGEAAEDGSTGVAGDGACLLARAIEDGVIKPGEIVPYESFARDAAGRPSLGAPGR